MTTVLISGSAGLQEIELDADGNLIQDVNFGQKVYVFPDVVIGDLPVKNAPTIYGTLSKLKTEDLIPIENVQINKIIWDNQYSIGSGCVQLPLEITSGILSVKVDYNNSLNIYQFVMPYDLEANGYTRKSYDGGATWSDWKNKETGILENASQLANTNIRIDEIIASSVVDAGEVELKIDQEIVERTDADAILTTDLINEISARTTADLTLTNNLAQEVNDRTNADTTLGTSISNEVTNRVNADVTLTNNLGQEVTDRIDAIDDLNLALSTDISNEINTRITNDNAIISALDQEIIDRDAYDTSLANNLASEIALRGLHDSTITDNLTQEISDREIGDTTVTNNLTVIINAEIQARIDADALLILDVDANTTLLAQEVIDRDNADTNLQTNIDGKQDYDVNIVSDADYVQTEENYTTIEKSKLGGIEALAEANMTGAEIKTVYEAEADTNAFDDAAVSKLGGIEALAEVNLTDVEISTLMKDYTETITNKELISYTNHIHAERLEYRVKATSSEIPIGAPVTIVEWNVTDGYPEAILANQATIVANAIAAETIPDGGYGQVIISGPLHGFDTSGWAEGTVLFVGNGILTSTEPVTGFSQPMAKVLKDSTEGMIQILAQYPKQSAADTRYDSTRSVKDLIDANVSNFITVTSSITATRGNYIYADTTSGAFDITLPATPVDNTKVTILDINSSFSTNNLTVLRNGENIMGAAADEVLSTDNTEYEFLFTGTDWRILQR